MRKGQFLRMQEQAWTQGLDLGRGIQRVAQHGVANALHVHPQLVGTARDRLQLDQRGRAAALQGAPAAYDFMFKTMQDEKADVRIRVRCAEFILTTAGHVPPKASENALTDDETKDAKDMSIKELDSMLSRIQAIKAKRAEKPTIIDVTPAPDKQPFDSLF